MTSNPYPEGDRDRDRWVLARRANAPVSTHSALDPFRPYHFLVEDERTASGDIASISTIFLTNRECPWRCLMCDLWRETLTETVAAGAIPAQIDYALSRLEPASQIKLYNNGSFFDHRAIPISDYQPIAARLQAFERVIVESHPALVGEDCLRFRDLISGRLEVALGLETAHPEVLARLNKRMTLDQFAFAASTLRRNAISLRVFILLKPPFLGEDEALSWAARSVEFAFACEAEVAVLIPTRFGNGALETLADQGQFSPPRLATVESALMHGIGLGEGRVFADVWGLERLATCQDCFPARAARLREMNMHQQILDP
ncbi:MAG TPA: radical SAM protein, partial [Blastocatellia bacterium]|nr:radical SAM protein [Blastocatellia bacterium]